jgi:hypothetical protein
MRKYFSISRVRGYSEYVIAIICRPQPRDDNRLNFCGCRAEALSATEMAAAGLFFLGDHWVARLTKEKPPSGGLL